AVYRCLSQIAENGVGHHGVVCAYWLSDGVLYRPFGATPAQFAAAGGHPAILDFTAVARICLDRHFTQRRLAEPVSYVDRHHLDAHRNLSHRYGGLYRSGVHLPAVFYPAAVHEPGQDGPAPFAGGLRSWRASVEGICHH